MLRRARRAAAQRLPEPLLSVVVRARHGELRWQRRFGFVAWSVLTPGRAGEGYSRRLVTLRGVRARFVDEFDAHEVQRENLAVVTSALADANIEYVLVPRARQQGTRVAIAAEDAARVVCALEAKLAGPEWAVEDIERSATARRPARGAFPVGRLSANWIGKRRGVRVYRWLAGSSDQVLAGPELACDIAFWNAIGQPGIERPDGGTFSRGTRIAPFSREVAVSYLSSDTWNEAVASLEHWPPRAVQQSLFDAPQPIDIVYTWVDGDDPLWRARRSAAAAGPALLDLNESAAHDSRYVSHDELRYSLRSVAMFASWVRKIFIVTDGQVPPWLNTEHPKIAVVDHSEIFSDTSVLPVFNSHAIESQLHHLPGLAEHYLYLNDDVFFGRPVRPELFFHGNGLSKFFLSRANLDLDPATSQDLPVMSAAKRNRGLIEQRFAATVYNKFKHTPHPQLRSVLESMELEYPDVFAQVARSRFRHPLDFSITSSFYHYYAYGTAHAVPGTIRYLYQDIARSDTPRRLGNLLRARAFDVFCLNDHTSEAERVSEQSEMLWRFFELYYPVSSSFECC